MASHHFTWNQRLSLLPHRKGLVLALKVSDIYSEENILLISMLVWKQILTLSVVVNSKNDWSQMQDRSGAFHFSIAWTLEPPDKDLIGITKALATSQMEEVSKIKVHVEDIKAKVGNVVQNIHLLSKVGESKGIFGF